MHTCDEEGENEEVWELHGLIIGRKVLVWMEKSCMEIWKGKFGEEE